MQLLKPEKWCGRILIVAFSASLVLVGYGQAQPAVNAHDRPRSYDDWFRAATSDIGAQEFEAARGDYAAALKVAGSDDEKLEASYGIAQMELLEKRYEDASKQLSGVADVKTSGNLTAAQSDIDQQKFPEARKLLEDILADHTILAALRFVAQVQLSQTYVSTQEFDRAITGMKSLESFSSSVPAAPLLSHMLVGTTLLEERHYDAGRDELTAVVNADTGGMEAVTSAVAGLMQMQARLEIATSYILDHKFDAAREAFGKLIADAGAYPKVRLQASKGLEIVPPPGPTP